MKQSKGKHLLSPLTHLDSNAPSPLKLPAGQPRPCQNYYYYWRQGQSLSRPSPSFGTGCRNPSSSSSTSFYKVLASPIPVAAFSESWKYHRKRHLPRITCSLHKVACDSKHGEGAWMPTNGVMVLGRIDSRDERSVRSLRSLLMIQYLNDQERALLFFKIWT